MDLIVLVIFPASAVFEICGDGTIQSSVLPLTIMIVQLFTFHKFDFHTTHTSSNNVNKMNKTSSCSSYLIRVEQWSRVVHDTGNKCSDRKNEINRLQFQRLFEGFRLF